MNWRTGLFASLVLFAGCGAKSNGVTPATSASAAGQSGTPESVLPESSATGDGAGGAGGAGDGAAFVRAAFDANAASKVEASCGADKLRLTLDGVLFDFDHDNLQPGADDVLAQVQKAGVDPYPTAHIVVEGHTDNVGTDAHNDDLSLRRAKTVVTWLQAHGVEAARLDAKGYGKRWPRVPNTTEANRAKNRRVELIVLDEKASTSCNSPGPAGPNAGILPPVQSGGGRDEKIVGEPHHGDPHGRPGPTETYHPEQFPAFSFLYNDDTKDVAHTCFSFDPSWVRPGVAPMGYLKKGYSLNQGHFVDHCPTEKLAATCDARSVVPNMQFYYSELTAPQLAFWKSACVGQWIPVGAAAPIAKIQPDTTGTYAVVCDGRQSPDPQCVEVRADANPTIIATWKQICTFPKPARCQTQGATGRCEQKGLITLYYKPLAEAAVQMRNSCESGSGSWSQP